jgi:hypothetical protein
MKVSADRLIVCERWLKHKLMAVAAGRVRRDHRVQIATKHVGADAGVVGSHLREPYEQTTPNATQSISTRASFKKENI